MKDILVHKRDPFSIWNAFKLILAIGLAIFVLSKTDRASLGATIEGASLCWLTISGVFFLLLTLLKALQYYILMRNELTYW
jgi:hypothetical protein